MLIKERHDWSFQTVMHLTNALFSSTCLYWSVFHSFVRQVGKCMYSSSYSHKLTRPTAYVGAVFGSLVIICVFPYGGPDRPASLVIWYSTTLNLKHQFWFDLATKCATIMNSYFANKNTWLVACKLQKITIKQRQYRSIS